MSTEADRPIYLQIILGSTRQNRAGELVARWVHAIAGEEPRVEAEYLDLKDFPMPFYEEPSGPLGLNGNYSSPVAKRWVQTVDQGDAYLFVTPEYNHSYPAVLKNAIDYAYAEWNRKPFSVVSYGGGAGGSRAAEQLRLVGIELQMAPIRAAVHIAGARRAFDESGQPTDANYSQQLRGVLNELVWWGRALRTARAAT